MGTLINSMPKYVASHHADRSGVANATVIADDAVAAVGRLMDDEDLRLVQNGIGIMSYRPRT